MKTLRSLQPLLFGLLLFCAPAVPLVSAKSPAPEVIVSANIKCLSLGRDLRGVEMYLSPDKRLPVHAAGSYISANHSYRGPQIVTFVKAKTATTGTPPAGAPTGPAAEPAVLATVELPPAGGDYLFLFSGSTDTKLEVVAVPFSSSDVPLGSCLVWNITHRPLGVMLGGDRSLLAPTQRRIFRPSAMAKDYVDFRIFDEYQGAPRSLAGGPHLLKENSRQLIFLVDRTPGGIPVQIRVIEEMPEQKPAPVVVSR
ncbi:MAG: hypothetical protein H7067_00405 [Burkholderiales bacterium]|nr:hypothetical protein [Opitutaceae bacterium]